MPENFVKKINQLYWVFFLFFVFLLFYKNHSVPLWDQDEAAYAGFAYQMQQSGDWVTPQFIWSDIHRKPPLHFWLIAASYKIFGVNFFAVRFHSTLSILLVCLFLFYLGRPIFGTPLAQLASLLMMGSLITSIGKIAFTDSLLLLFETCAVLSLLRFLKTPNWNWCFLFWGTISLGMLTKGPPILILCGGLFVFLLIFHPDRKLLLKLHPWFFLPLSLSPILIWGALAWQKDGGNFIRWFLDWYIFKRAKGEVVLVHEGKSGYFLLTFVITLFPWFGYFLSGLIFNIQKIFHKDKLALFLFGWILFGWIFYELVRSKLPMYALGAYPALFYMCASTILFFSDSHKPLPWILKLGTGLQILIFIGMGGGLCIGSFAASFKAPIPLPTITLMSLGVFVSLAGVLGTVLFLKRKIFLGLFCHLLCSFVFLFVAWTWIVPSLNTLLFTTKSVADAIEQLSLSQNLVLDLDSNLLHTRPVPSPTASPLTKVIFGRDFGLPSLPFYLAQKNHPYQEVLNLEKLKTLLGSTTPHVFVFDQDRFNELKEFISSHAQKYQIDGFIPDKGKPITFWIIGI